MKEATNIKTGQVYHISDEEYEILKEKRQLRKYRFHDVKPIRPVNIIIPDIKKSPPKPKDK